MSDNSQITQGSQVTLHFALATSDGTEITSTFDDEPTTLTLGDGSLTETLEKTLLGLSVGEKQSMLLESDDAFGPRDEEKTQQIPLASFPEDMAVEPDLVISFTTPAGGEVAGIVRSIEDEQVNVDFNHPLAGHDVVFTVQILAVENG